MMPCPQPHSGSDALPQAYGTLDALASKFFWKCGLKAGLGRQERHILMTYLDLPCSMKRGNIVRS